MTLKTQMALDNANVFFNIGEFAEASTHTNSAGLATSFNGVWDYQNFHAEFQTAGESLNQTAVVAIPRASVASPEKGDTIKDSVNATYEILSIENQDDNVSMVSARKITKTTVGHIRNSK